MFKEKVNVKVIVRVKDYLCLRVPLIKKLSLTFSFSYFFPIFTTENVIKMTTNTRPIYVITFKSSIYTI